MFTLLKKGIILEPMPKETLTLDAECAVHDMICEYFKDRQEKMDNCTYKIISIKNIIEVNGDDRCVIEIHIEKNGEQFVHAISIRNKDTGIFELDGSECISILTNTDTPNRDRPYAVFGGIGCEISDINQVEIAIDRYKQSYVIAFIGFIADIRYLFLFILKHSDDEVPEIFENIEMPEVKFKLTEDHKVEVVFKEKYNG